MKTKKIATLEEQYIELFKQVDVAAQPDDMDLSQPYLGRIVPTITTYSTSELQSVIGE